MGGRNMDIEIASVKDVAPGKMVGVEKNGKSILIANVDGTYHAIGNICTHMGCNLSEGTLTGDTVQCACHGSIFNVKTGAVEQGPAGSPELSFSLRVDGDRILADL
jgi:nitrite reductase/ring-hydroxylating ferredoxin subunit